MAAIRTIDELMVRLAEGKGADVTIASIASIAGAAPIATTGLMGVIPFFEAIGTTLHSTLVSPRIPTGEQRLVSGQLSSTRGLTYVVSRLHRMGTVNLAATGNQFTADAGVFPVLRTEMGQASQPQTLVPVILVTTATATTAVVLKMDYRNQDGVDVTGTVQTTFPTVATAAGSAYVPRLEVGDSGIQKINAINIDTASAAGAAVMLGLEQLDLMTLFVANIPSSLSFMRGYNPAPMEAPAPTSGSLTSYLGITAVGSVSATTIRGVLRTVSNA